jgi:hypothetical protein
MQMDQKAGERQLSSVKRRQKLAPARFKLNYAGVRRLRSMRSTVHLNRPAFVWVCATCDCPAGHGGRHRARSAPEQSASRFQEPNPTVSVTI